VLSSLYDDFAMDFHLELRANQKAIWLNYPFWALRAPETSVLSQGRRLATLQAIREDWPTTAPPLPELSDQV
jgi:hypothetical protein